MAASTAFDVSAQRRRSDRPSTDRGRVGGRYDAGRTPLPPGGQLAAMPRDAMRAQLEKRLKSLRGLLRRATVPAEIARLQADIVRLQATLAEVGEHVVTAGIIDPMGEGRSTIKATVNRRTDILELERSHGRISEGAYLAGRKVQDVLEKSSRISGSQWNDTPGIRSSSSGAAVARAMMRAAETRKMLDFIEGRLGMIDTRLLRRVLGDRMSFGDCAALQGKAGEKGTAYIGGRVRDALEDLADAFASRGMAQPVPDDAYKAAADAMATRQDDALAGGGTLARLEAELAELETVGAAPGTAERQAIDETRAAAGAMRLRQATATARRHR